MGGYSSSEAQFRQASGRGHKDDVQALLNSSASVDVDAHDEVHYCRVSANLSIIAAGRLDCATARGCQWMARRGGESSEFPPIAPCAMIRRQAPL